jgi:hypothetical protein
VIGSVASCSEWVDESGWLRCYFEWRFIYSPTFSPSHILDYSSLIPSTFTFTPPRYLCVPGYLYNACEGFSHKLNNPSRLHMRITWILDLQHPRNTTQKRISWIWIEDCNYEWWLCLAGSGMACLHQEAGERVTVTAKGS